MPTDNTIALQVKSPEMNAVPAISALAQYQMAQAHSGLYQLQAQRQAGTLGALQEVGARARAGQSIEEAAKPLLGWDPALYKQTIEGYQAGRQVTAQNQFGASGDPISVRMFPEIYKTALEAVHQGGANVAQRLEILGRVGNAALSDPTPQGWRNAATTARNAGMLPNVSDLEFEQIARNPNPAIAHQWVAAGQAAKDYAETSGSAAGAQAGAKAPYEFETVEGPRGQKQVYSKAQLAAGAQAVPAAPALPPIPKDVSDRLDDYAKRDISTPSELVNRWNAAYIGKNTQPQANYLAKQLGVSPTTKLDLTDPQVRSKISKTMEEIAGSGVTPGPMPIISGQTKEQSAQSKTLGEDAAKTFQDAGKSYVAAKDSQLGLTQLRKDLAELPTDGGWLTPGTKAGARVAWAKELNTALQTAGLKPFFDPQQIAAAEQATKTTTRLGFDTAKILGSRESQQIIQQAVGVQPGIENTPLGARRIMAGLYMASQRMADRYEFMNQYRSDPKSGGSLVGADVAFNQVHSPQSYAEKAHQMADVPLPAISKLETLRSDPVARQHFDATFGNGLADIILGPIKAK